MAARIVLIAIVLGAFALPSVATAQHGDVSEQVRFADDLDPNEFMLTGRFRAVAVPNFALGIFFEEHPSHWSGGQRNFSYGGEFVWRRGNDFELGLAFDYADLSMPDGFWQQTGENPTSANFSEVDLQLYSVVFTAYWFWDVEPWVSPYLGGGVGLGFTGGDVIHYDPNENHSCYDRLGDGGDAGFAPAVCYEDDEAIDFEDPDVDENIWPVYPMVNLTTGVRFNIAEHGVLKLEAGIHPYAFAGTAVGVQF